MKKYILILAMALIAVSCSKDKELPDPKVLIASTSDFWQTDSDYSSSGFSFNGTTYYYTFDWIIECTFVGTENASRIGYVIDDDYYWDFDDFGDGKKTSYMTTYSKKSYSYKSVKAFAKKSDGTYIYGSVKSLKLEYGGKSDNQALDLELTIENEDVIHCERTE